MVIILYVSSTFLKMLYIIATPIGNLEDITLRALKVLRKVNYIFAEDTRRTVVLLKKFKIKNKKVESLHKFNEFKKQGKILDLLNNNESVAIVSDAGTPLVSDPGENIVKMCFEKNLKVVPIPGVSALTTLLSVCPFENKEFIFTGFLEKSKQKRKNQFLNLLKTGKNIFFFESPNRILSTLKILNEISENLKILIGRELTKYHEEIIYNKVSNLIEIFEKKTPIGEFTVGVRNNLDINNDEYLKDINLMRSLSFSNRDIISFITKKYNLKKNKIYEYLKDN